MLNLRLQQAFNAINEQLDRECLNPCAKLDRDAFKAELLLIAAKTLDAYPRLLEATKTQQVASMGDIRAFHALVTSLRERIEVQQTQINHLAEEINRLKLEVGK